MKISAIVAALLFSALALGTGSRNSRYGTEQEVEVGQSSARATSSLQSASTSIRYILSTVSADFALPGRPIAV